MEYLTPAVDHVIEGLKDRQVVFAKDQPEYLPLTALMDLAGNRVLSRWPLSDEQRAAVARGADVFLEVSTFGRPLQPLRVFIADKDSDYLADSIAEEYHL